MSTPVTWAYLARWNPELIDRRMCVGEGTKIWDKVWGRVWPPDLAGTRILADSG